MAQANPYPLRVDKTTMDKFKVIAKKHGRSVNKEVEILMEQAVIQYEKEFGSISTASRGVTAE